MTPTALEQLEEENAEAKFDSYPEYKNTEPEWLGKIPSHWDIKRLKFCADVNPSKKELDDTDKDLKATFLPMEKVTEDGEILDSDEKRIDDVIDDYTYFREDDVLVAKITPCFENGKGAFPQNLKNNIGFGTTEFVVIRPNECLLNKFFYYLTRSPLFREVGEGMMKGAAGQKRVPESFFRNFPQFLPKKSEQKAIVEFLDREIGQIDRFIEEKKHLINLLENKRKTLINEKVTKGLNQHVEMRSPEIEWLEEIPKDWDVYTLRQITNVRPSNVDKKTKEDEEEVKLCNYTDVYYQSEIDSEIEFMEATAKLTEIEDFRLNEGEVIVTKDSEDWKDISVPAYVAEDFDEVLCGYHLAKIEPDPEKVEGKFLYYAILSEGISHHFKVEAKGVTRFGLSTDSIKKARIPIPGKNKQQEIVDFLDRETEKIENTKKKINKAIAKLKEYRSTLINEAVTGQIDVRNSG
jgi:type I restriction enzyme S subunit